MNENEEELYPRRWLVKTRGTLREVRSESKASVLTLFPGEARLMGTNESVKHAAKRIGWAA